MHSAELGHRVVAVLDEDPFVELLGPLHADGGIDRLITLDVELANELVEEQTPQALVRPGVAGEERPFTTSGRLTRANTGLSRLVK